MQEFDRINKLRKSVEKQWDSLAKKILQIYSNRLNNWIESGLYWTKNTKY